MPYYVYIISSKFHKYMYIGYTGDLTKRLFYHNRGFSRATKPYRPFELIYVEVFSSKSETIKREFYLKKFKSGKALKQLISRGGGVDNRISL